MSFNLGDWINKGADVYTKILDNKTAQQTTEQAQAAIEIEKTRLEQTLAELESDRLLAESNKKQKPSSYVLPIIVTGVVIAGGIATYFIFKNKK